MIKVRFVLFALVVVALLMAVLILNSRLVATIPDQLMVRPVEMVAVMPPPPQPQNISKAVLPQTLALDLRHKGQGPSLTLSKVQVKMNKPQLTMPILELLTPEFDGHSTSLDLSGFALNELDQQPRLMTPLDIEFTAKMQGAGVKKVNLKLHVVIDQNGHVHLKSIIKNPYPELNLAIKRLTKRARFSVPQRQGKNVKAEFIWPLVLKES